MYNFIFLYKFRTFNLLTHIFYVYVMSFYSIIEDLKIQDNKSNLRFRINIKCFIHEF